MKATHWFYGQPHGFHQLREPSLDDYLLDIRRSSSGDLDCVTDEALAAYPDQRKLIDTEYLSRVADLGGFDVD